jgi:hypothetical protein
LGDAEELASGRFGRGRGEQPHRKRGEDDYEAGRSHSPLCTLADQSAAKPIAIEEHARRYLTRLGTEDRLRGRRC